MRRCVFAVFCVLCASPVFGADPDPIANLKNKVVERRLANGLRLLVVERHTAPLVSFQMLFRVGGVDEEPGRTGLAHLFEHMLFKGSQTVGTKDFSKEKTLIDKLDLADKRIRGEESKGPKADPETLKKLREDMKSLEEEQARLIIPAEFDEIYQRNGARGLNAFTGRDMTGFVVSLPSNRWELWPILESDRMKRPVLREFYKERDVVMEERRMRYEDHPRGKIWEEFLAHAFIAHPYRLPTIGWMSDVRNLTRPDAVKFYESHYVPGNAVLAVVGDVDAGEVGDKLERYFAGIPSGEIPKPSAGVEPKPSGERRVLIDFDAEPTLLLGYHKPNQPHPDDTVFSVIEQILSRGRTSRFNRNIVDKKLAVSAWASNGVPGERYPNLIVFGGSPRNPHGNRELEGAIISELEKLAQEPVSPREIEKVANGLESDFIRLLASNEGLASQLSYAEAVLGNWREPFEFLERARKVTPEDVRRVAREYFKRSNLTSAWLERAAGKGKP